jgi:hypothetical protein
MLLLGIGSFVMGALLVAVLLVIVSWGRSDGSLILIAPVVLFQIASGITLLKNRNYLRDEASETLNADHATCTECKGVFDVHDMIAHGGVYVCAGCKPRFLQKLAEGVKVPEPAITSRRNFWLLLAIVAAIAIALAFALPVGIFIKPFLHMH